MIIKKKGLAGYECAWADIIGQRRVIVSLLVALPARKPRNKSRPA